MTEKNNESRLYDRVVLSSHPSKSEHSLHGCEPVYILAACDIQPITKEDLLTDFEITKLKHPIWKDKTFEHFLKFKAEMFETKYNVDIYETAYFLNPLTACDYAKKNMADINEAGAYPYLVVYSRPTNHMYAESNQCFTQLFKYVKDTDTYREIEDITVDEQYIYIVSKFDIFQKPDKESIEYLK